MVIIRMTGGLGNQMFQYALYLKLCSMGKEVKFDDFTEYEGRDARPVMLWVFGIDYPRATKEELNRITDGFLKLSHRIRRKLFGRKSLEYHEKDGNFDEQVLAKEPAYLTGYFQSEKYFKDIEDKVRQAFIFSDKIWNELDDGKSGGDEFKFKNSMRQRVEQYLKQIGNCLSVSVHVRRGDYLENDEVYGGICTEKYYCGGFEKMMDVFPEAIFFMFSNDVEWVGKWVKELCGKLKLSEDRFVVVEGTTENTGYFDLLLMSRCRHHILANSSFSWWGAWLNASKDKLVIAPSKWFNNQELKDIYTEEMIRISPEGECIKA
ncbi:alpha-1,2-fucosyltransferase [Parablautia muri]|uniref:Alpha-1,2-fucosyltransferase n=1 Tax=Parablautia muri TaxID=2320879 RepID=A0A9X5BCQ5_9FIRM|nr:alpha-1,2-fucosyltransferase [Parablautia muri]NBJ91295.1 alpha-1,2-fucosyltransferase [Parablautia muri]